MEVRQCKTGDDGVESSGPSIIYGSVMTPVYRDSLTEIKHELGKVVCPPEDTT